MSPCPTSLTTWTPPGPTCWHSPPSPPTCGARSGPDNPQERLNKEIRRRTDTVGIFPHRDAITRLVGAVLAEQTDEWAQGRRYISLEVLKRCRQDPDTDTSTNSQEPKQLTTTQHT